MADTATKPRRRRESNIPADETPEARFIRVAPMRTNKVIAAVRNLAQTSTRASYSYTPEQAARIVAAVRAEADKLEQAFAAGGVGRSEFSL